MKDELYHKPRIISMIEEQSEGIVLKSTDFKESSRIVTLFTKRYGIVNLIVKRISKKKPTLINLSSPLCRADYVYLKGRSTLYTFSDGTILDLHMPLRSSYKHLQVAGELLRTILTTQEGSKPTPVLYDLLCAYLKHLPSFPDPEIIGISFQLKLLRHDGILMIDKVCNHCQECTASSLYYGESLCRSCAPNGSLHFSEEEWDLLRVLFAARNFETLKELDLKTLAQSKLHLLLESLGNVRVHHGQTQKS